MFKTIIKVTAIILISQVLCGFNPSVKAAGNSGKNFMLPKSFKINDAYLPPIDTKPEPQKDKAVSTSNPTIERSKAVSVTTIKSNSTVTTTEIKNKIPAVQKQSSSIITTNSAKNNNIKSNITQTNPIKTSSVNKTNNAVSLTNLIKNYENSYSDTLKSTIIALSSMGITPDSYNTEKGQIIAKLPSGKEIFILVVPFNERQTCVRITPIDGNYNMPMIMINEIFSNIKDDLPAN